MNYSPSWESNSCSASCKMPCFLWNPNFCCCINKTLYNVCDRKIGNVLATIMEFLALLLNSQTWGSFLIVWPQLLMQFIHIWSLYLNTFSFIHSQSICHAVMKHYLLWFLCVFAICADTPVVSVCSTSACNRCLAEPDAVLVWEFFVCCVEFRCIFISTFYTPPVKFHFVLFLKLFFFFFRIHSRMVCFVYSKMCFNFKFDNFHYSPQKWYLKLNPAKDT